MEYREKYLSPLGELTLVSDGSFLTGVWFGQVRREIKEKELSTFALTREWLNIYFRGDIPDFLPPMRMAGTAFRREVWDILLEIPYGETVTYGEIAGQLAKRRNIARMSAQAVGGAVGHNPISILVPCHRVIGSDGSMTGYGGGIEKKIGLLELERANGISNVNEIHAENRGRG